MAAAPFRKCGAEEVGRETEDDEEAVPGAKGTGWGETGVVRKGTAAGRSGDEKTGGPGGVLNRAGPLGLGMVGLPRADAEERARGGVKTVGKGGDACAACGCGCGGVKTVGNGGDACAACGCGGVSSMLALPGDRRRRRRSKLENLE